MNTYFNILTGRLLGDRTILRPRLISRFESTDQTVNPRLEEVSSYPTEPEAAAGILEQRPTVDPLVQPKKTPSTPGSGAVLEERLSQVVQKLPVPASPNPSQVSNFNPPAIPDSEAILPSQTSPSSPNPYEVSASETSSLSQTSPKASVNQPLAIIPQSQITQSSSPEVPASGRIKSQILNYSEISPLKQDSEVGLSRSSAERATQSQPLTRPLFAEVEPAPAAPSPTRKHSPQAGRFDEGSSLSQAVPEPVKLISPRERLLHHRPEEIPSGSVSSASQPPSLPPPIQVTIGRIEVKAVSPPPAPTRRPATPVAPALSLEEYLKQRGGTG